MKKEQLAAILRDIEEDLKEQHVMATHLFDLGDLKYSSYSSVALMLKSQTIESDDINYMSLSELKNEIASFEDELKNSDLIIDPAVEADVEASMYFDSINKITLETYGYTIIGPKALEAIIQNRKRKRISELLRPENLRHAVTPDCKMIELFNTGTIDWDTLRSITYGTCKS